MRKMTQLFVVGFLVFGLIVLNTASLLVPVSAETKTENQQQHLQSYEPTVTENSILSFNFTKDYYAVGETIVATVQVSSPLTGQPSYDGNGAIVTSAVLSKDNLTATVKMQITGLGEENSLTLLLPTETETIQTDVFFYTSHSLVFCGLNFKTSAKERACYYLYDMRIITSQEKEKIIDEIDSESILAVGDEVLDFLPYNLQRELENKIENMNQVQERSVSLDTEEVDTCIYGMIFWQGEQGVFPLKNTYLEVGDKSGNSYSYWDTIVTNERGEYEYWFQNNSSAAENGGYDPYIKVLAKTEVLSIKQNEGDEEVNISLGGIEVYSCSYSNVLCSVRVNARREYADSVPENVVTGSRNHMSMIIKTGGEDDDTTGIAEKSRGIVVSQALNFAARYAWQIVESMVWDSDVEQLDYTSLSPTINVVYGTVETSNYNETTQTIYINYLHYRNWDPILHEYGHYFAHKLEIFESTNGSGSHDFFTNMGEERGKEDGLKIAWNEAIATVFSILVTQFFTETSDFYNTEEATYLCDTLYNTHEDKNMFNIEERGITEDGYSYGEDCEGAIARVLYDIYDLQAEENDQIGLGHFTFWRHVLNSKATTFSTFYQYILNLVDIFKLGGLLTEARIASYELELTNETNSYGVPKFSWEVGNIGWNVAEPLYPNDRFILNFYDGNGNLITQSGSVSSPYGLWDYSNTKIKIAPWPDEWEAILNAPGQTFSVCVLSKTNSAPQTGWYWSKKYHFSKL